MKGLPIAATRRRRQQDPMSRRSPSAPRSLPRARAMHSTPPNPKPAPGPHSRKLAAMLRDATPEQIKQAEEIAVKLLVAQAKRLPRPRPKG